MKNKIAHRFLKFGSVGALGTVTNLLIYSSLIFLNINYNIASASAFVVAVAQNFVLNKRWTFDDHDVTIKHRFVKYFALNFVSFLLNLAILNFVIYLFGTEKVIQIVAQVLGIAGAMVTNFIGSHLLVFKTGKGRA
ncbi:MAG: GtrA family protein [Campylobacterota bacterium]|nr:GtrA family protein [Campylobacterota bacterium]